MIPLLIIAVAALLILRRTRFRNGYQVMSQEWMEYQGDRGRKCLNTKTE